MHVDLGRAEVIEVIDHAARDGVDPAPSRPQPAATGPTTWGRSVTTSGRSTSCSPGPSFEVDGQRRALAEVELRASGWHPLDGLVLLHTVGYEDQGRVRPILHARPLSEMVVPYGEAALGHRWRARSTPASWGSVGSRS